MDQETSWVESMPGMYDEHLGPALFAPFARHLAVLAAKASPARVLEIAAGTGIATAELARVLPAAQIVATDLNESMVAWASARLSVVGWEQADATHLRFTDGSFDLVLCQFGVMFFPDKPAAFAEAARVLDPAGRMVFSVWDEVETSGFPAAMVAALAAVVPGAAPDFISRVPHGYHDPDRIMADLDAGGLRAETMERVVLRGRAVSAESLTRGFCLGTPLRFALEKCGPLVDLVPALEAEMVARLGPGPVTADLAAYVIEARPAGHHD